MVDFGESDRIVHLLTPGSGRLTAMAKGARRSVKRFPGTLDLFNHLRVQLYRSRPGRMAYLQQAQLLSPQLDLRERPRRFALACYLLELLDRLSPEGGAADEAQQLFEYALRAFRAIGRCEPDLRLRTLFELRTLDALGFRPELRHCVRCSREPRADSRQSFHVGEGGVLCANCVGPGDGTVLMAHSGTLRTLEAVLRLGVEQMDRVSLSSEALEEATRIVHRFGRFHVGVELRSERFLNEILGPGWGGVA